MKSYSYSVQPVTSLVRNNLQFSQLVVTFDMQRNSPFFTLTVFVPILLLTVLAPVGLILPGYKLSLVSFSTSWCLSMIITSLLKVFLADAGEKMGLQITILLADIIYVEILQSTVPVFDSYGNTPLILTFFIVSIILNCICLLISAHTLYMYHCPDYEVRNFSRTEARIGCPRNEKSGYRK